jgi:hypothetical protein
MYVSARLGEISAQSVKISEVRGAPQSNSKLLYKGHVVMSQEKVVIDMYSSSDGQVWAPFLVNGSFPIKEDNSFRFEVRQK